MADRRTDFLDDLAKDTEAKDNPKRNCHDRPKRVDNINRVGPDVGEVER